MSKVAVQLISWNGEAYLKACLDSLAKQSYADFDLFVLDNGSNDGSVSVIESATKNFSQKVNFVRGQDNLGFTGGHNQLFALGDNEYVFCVNQDVVLHEDYLKNLIDFLEKNKNVGSVSGLLRHEDGSMDSVGLKMSWYGKVSDITNLLTPESSSVKVFGVSGALPCYRRSAVLQVSPDGKIFDNNFFAYKEDVDLAWRLSRFGWGSYVITSAQAIHERGFGTNKKWKSGQSLRQKLSSRNHLLMLVKNIDLTKCWMIPILVCYEVVKLIYIAIFVPKALSYAVEFISLLPETLKIRKVLALRLKSLKKNG